MGTNASQGVPHTSHDEIGKTPPSSAVTFPAAILTLAAVFTPAAVFRLMAGFAIPSAAACKPAPTGLTRESVAGLPLTVTKAHRVLQHTALAAVILHLHMDLNLTCDVIQIDVETLQAGQVPEALEAFEILQVQVEAQARPARSDLEHMHFDLALVVALRGNHLNSHLTGPMAVIFIITKSSEEHARANLAHAGSPLLLLLALDITQFIPGHEFDDRVLDPAVAALHAHAHLAAGLTLLNEAH